ncbi:MAG: twin-arginine translocase subunit TatC [Spirochaetaceae bacterium]|nr:MAG: twin-arginine translocase subunit TatC [Spirochaetaceae bacterium]
MTLPLWLNYHFSVGEVRRKRRDGEKNNPQAEMSFLDHLRELRKRIIVSMIAILCAAIVSYIFFEYIVSFLFNPFREIEALSIRDEILFINTIFEGFLVRLKVAILSGIVFSLPVHVFNLIRFVLPGLTGKEKKVILISLIVSFCLIVFSFYYGYFKVIPISIGFLSSSGFVPEDVGLLLNYGKNIFVIFQFLMITVILFQLPIILEILMIMNVLSRKALLKASRFIVVGIFVLSAIVTPPDFVSQVSLALPLVGLFFLTILVARIFNFGKEQP